MITRGHAHLRRMLGKPRATRVALASLSVVLVILSLTVALQRGFIAHAQGLGPQPALPQVFTPFAGDPRLEPIPGVPINLTNVNVVGEGHTLTMRFPPRVNGQTASDGDGHADMYVLFYAFTGIPVNQPPILEAVPNGATGPGAKVPDLTARKFSSIWELHAVVVDGGYDPNNPDTRIDSAIKVTGPGASPAVQKIFQTNIFLNCPIVPAGTTLDPVPGGPVANEPRLLDAFFEGQIVHIVPYDVEDGPFNPQVLFKFEDPSGNTVMDASGAPYLVASKIPGQSFYSTIWEIWTVHVPNTAAALALKTKAAVNNSGFQITSSGIRLNCPVVAVDGVPFPFEDWKALLTGPSGVFLLDPNAPRFPFDVPEVFGFRKQRTHVVTEVNLPIFTAAPAPAGGTVASQFPTIEPDTKGNVIPLIFKDPFQVLSSGPTTTGDIIRLNQPELDAAFANNNPPQLPAAFEANISKLIQAGLLAREWAPGGRSYQERLALLGRAFFELVWTPQQGANSKNATRCLACHSMPATGGTGRGLYVLETGGLLVPGHPEFGPVNQQHPGSMWGGGAAELLNNQMRARGIPNLTFAHGKLGTIATLRGVASNALNNHVGIQSVEFIASQPIGTPPTGVPASVKGNILAASQFDLDGDGIVNELTPGELTAITAFAATLAVPNEVQPNPTNPNDADLLASLGITYSPWIDWGRQLFTDSIDNRGAGCASCHTVFQPLTGTQLNLKNPETASVLALQMPHHSANADEVARGFASFVGQPGLRLYGDFRKHKLGAQMFCSQTDLAKTKDLWDAGSVFPYGKCGQFGSDMMRAILAHEGVMLQGVSVTKGAVVQSVDSTGRNLYSQNVTITNTTGSDIFASGAKPIRVVLVGSIADDYQAVNAASPSPDGGFRQGAYWLINNPIPAGGSVTMQLVFTNPNTAPSVLGFSLAIQDDAGFSEAVASIQAFRNLEFGDPQARQSVVNFLRLQMIQGALGEGSGAALPAKP